MKIKKYLLGGAFFGVFLLLGGIIGAITQAGITHSIPWYTWLIIYGISLLILIAVCAIERSMWNDLVGEGK